MKTPTAIGPREGRGRGGEWAGQWGRGGAGRCTEGAGSHGRCDDVTRSVAGRCRGLCACVEGVAQAEPGADSRPLGPDPPPAPGIPRDVGTGIRDC